MVAFTFQPSVQGLSATHLRKKGRGKAYNQISDRVERCIKGLSSTDAHKDRRIMNIIDSLYWPHHMPPSASGRKEWCKHRWVRLPCRDPPALQCPGDIFSAAICTLAWSPEGVPLVPHREVRIHRIHGRSPNPLLLLPLLLFCTPHGFFHLQIWM